MEAPITPGIGIVSNTREPPVNIEGDPVTKLNTKLLNPLPLLLAKNESLPKLSISKLKQKSIEQFICKDQDKIINQNQTSATCHGCNTNPFQVKIQNAKIAQKIALKKLKLPAKMQCFGQKSALKEGDIADKDNKTKCQQSYLTR